jgi:hypothetical protein
MPDLVLFVKNVKIMLQYICSIFISIVFAWEHHMGPKVEYVRPGYQAVFFKLNPSNITIIYIYFDIKAAC